MLPLIDDTWRRALSMYQSYIKDRQANLPCNEADGNWKEPFVEKLNSALLNGEATLLQALIDTNGGNALLDPEEYEFEQIDPLTIVTQLLYVVIKYDMDVLESAGQTHLTKDVSGNPRFDIDDEFGPYPGEPWGPTQIDVRHTRPFSCIPTEREARLRMEIALHRQLWDLSVRLRTRRANRLIELATAG